MFSISFGRLFGTISIRGRSAITSFIDKIQKRYLFVDSLTLTCEADKMMNLNDYINYLTLIKKTQVVLDSEQMKFLENELYTKQDPIEPKTFQNLLDLIVSGYLKNDEKLGQIISKNLVENNTRLSNTILFKILELVSSKKFDLKDYDCLLKLRDDILAIKDILTLQQFTEILNYFSEKDTEIGFHVLKESEQCICKLIESSEAAWICSLMKHLENNYDSKHYLDIAEAISKKITENPSPYFEVSSESFVHTSVFFSHFQEFEEISRLIENFVPEIKHEMYFNTAALGQFFISVIKKPPSNKYKYYIVSQMLKNYSRFKQKDIFTMVAEMIDDENLLFWSNVQDFKISWDKFEPMSPKTRAVLESHGLIRPLN